MKRTRAVQAWEDEIAALGDTSCMINLAVHLTSGRGVGRDLEAALRWERRAVLLGEPTAAMNAALTYKAMGKHRQAFAWLLRAQEMGNDVDLELAKARLFGAGTRRDPDAAVAGLKRVTRSTGVAEIERIEARLLLAWLYWDGTFVARSYEEHRRWLARAGVAIPGL